MNINPQYITDFKGSTFAVIPIKEYEELLSRIEELEDLELYLEGKEDQVPGEPAKIVFKRIEKNRTENGTDKKL